MATQTSNLGLTKPAYSETADIADINNNMDKVDAAVHGVQNGMAILANGNVHSAVTSGQYVYVRNHGTLAEGLYTATTNISTNATLSTSNLTAVPNNGALNTLRDDVTSLNSKLSSLYSRSIGVLYTIPANGQWSTNLYTIINQDLPSGYEVLGIVGLTTNDTKVYAVSYQYYNGNYSFQLKNTSNAEVTGNATVRYLCIKSN